jgi:hypothetical protein
MRRGRLPVLVVIGAMLAAGGFADRAGRTAGPATVAVASGPVAPPASATSSTWFCTGGNARLEGEALGSVVIANTGRTERRGTVTVVPDEGRARTVAVRVPASGRAGVLLAAVVSAPFASALVELDGGEVVAELITAGPTGDSATPCASSASDAWYFAEGATTRDAAETLMVFNPFPEDALADVSFSTESGRVVPQRLAGLVVPGRGMRAVAVGEHARRREAVSTTVTSRVGRLVVARLQSFTGSGDVPRRGVSVALGSPATAPVWYFPEGFRGDGVTELVQIYNPTSSEARVEVDANLDLGDADPVELTVPNHARVTFVANDEPRIPANVGHAIVVRSLNGVGVVAERTFQAMAPSRLTGLAITPGSTRTATRWAFAAGEPDAAVEEWITILNPGRAPVTASVTALGDGVAREPALQRLQVPADSRLQVRLSDELTRPVPAVVVQSSGPVVVERDLYRLLGPGRAMAMGIPL